MGWRQKYTSPAKCTGYFYVDEEKGIKKEIALHSSQDYHKDYKRHRGVWYSEDKKVEVAALYAVLRNVEKTAKISNVYPFVVRTWMKEPWWDIIISRVRKEKNEELDAKMTQVIDKALDVVSDRLDNGDFVLTNKGELKRKPVGMRDTSGMMAVLMDKRQVLRGEPTTITESVKQEDKLEKLRNQFERFASAKEIIPDETENQEAGLEAQAMSEAGRSSPEISEGRELGVDEQNNSNPPGQGGETDNS